MLRRTSLAPNLRVSSLRILMASEHIPRSIHMSCTKHMNPCLASLANAWSIMLAISNLKLLAPSCLYRLTKSLNMRYSSVEDLLLRLLRYRQASSFSILFLMGIFSISFALAGCVFGMQRLTLSRCVLLGSLGNVALSVCSIIRIGWRLEFTVGQCSAHGLTAETTARWRRRSPARRAARGECCRRTTRVASWCCDPNPPVNRGTDNASPRTTRSAPSTSERRPG